MTYKLIDYEKLKAFSEGLKSKYATKNDLPKNLADLQDDENHKLISNKDKELLQKSLKGISIGIKAGEPDLFFNVGRNNLTTYSTKIPLAKNNRHGLLSSIDKKKIDAIPVDPKYTDTIPDLSGYATKSELNKKIDKSSISDNFTEQSKDKILSQKGACELGMQLSIEIENATKTKAEKSDIPTSLSQLTNDKTFKTESEIQSMIEKASSLKKEVVTSLPTTGKDDVIYLVKDPKGKDSNNYLEYLWLNGKYELIGSTQVDLSGYAQLTDITASKVISIYELDKDFRDALKNDQDFLAAIKRDMLTLVAFKGNNAEDLMGKAGFETVLYYKGQPVGVVHIVGDADSGMDKAIREDTMPKEGSIINWNVLSTYNSTIQAQLKEQKDSSLNKSDIQEFTQQELEEAFK